jgi:TP901 family phage tail tape measure protein
MSALREVFARFSVEVDDKKLDNLNKKVDAGVSSLSKFGSVIVGALGAGAMVKYAAHLSEVGDQIAKDANRIGITGERLQELGFAAGQGGASIQGLKVALLSLSDRMADAGQGGKETAEQFSRLGIHVKDASGHLRSSDEVMLDAADAIAKMGSPTEQAAAAMKVFGRQGRELLPFLKEGRAGIEKLTEEAKELGGGFSGEALEASENYNDALGRMSFAMTSVQGRIAKALLPAMQKLVDAGTKVVAWFLKMTKNSKLVEVGLVALGVVITAFAIKAAVALAPVIAPFVLWGIIIGGIILLVEDLYVWFKGGKSVIGEWLTALLGVDGANKVLQTTRAIVSDIANFIRQVVDDVAKLIDLAEAATGIKKGKALAADNAPVDPIAARALGTRYAREHKVKVRRGEVKTGNLGTLTPEILSGEREIRGGKSGIGAPVTHNAVNVVVNAGNADARETARLVREQVKSEIARGNHAASVAITREKPAAE